MRLHYAATSPYVRKVMVAAHECGLAGQLELMPTARERVRTDVTPDNPLARIPTLITDAGEVLYDSLVICEYLDHLADAGLFPPPGAARWDAMRRHALGQGLINAAVRCRNAGQPPDDEILRALGALDAKTPPDRPDIGVIAVACALGYLDFRFADLDWRTSRPMLATWYAPIAARPSMTATAHPTD